jgi:hypothetical protein
MKKALVLLLFLTGCTACFTKGVPLMEVPKFVDTSAVMRLVGRWNVAHACPVDGVVLTAAHVVSPFHHIPIVGNERIGYTWSDRSGNQGFVTGAAANLQRDLGMLVVGSGAPWFYKHALEEPKPGDVLQWVEYDFGSVENAYAANLRHAKLVRIVSGHLVLDDVPTKGASGSCLFNSESEVAGLIVWGVRVGDRQVGVAASISGSWWPESLPGAK